ncbi:MAG: 30S ribosomal protein S8 [Candidatus Omnitrophica bacterium]|nr:30S ribosomal protein S8 [Candidatus Omnitrophota bacterium]
MSISDSIGDMLTVIRNASRAKKEITEYPASRLGGEILRILKREGYIKNYRAIEDNKQGVFRVYLRYRRDKSPFISNLRRISKPGLRVYVKKDKIPFVLKGFGIAILSTSRGVMTDREAREFNAGGEVLCYVW